MNEPKNCYCCCKITTAIKTYAILYVVGACILIAALFTSLYLKLDLGPLDELLEIYAIALSGVLFTVILVQISAYVAVETERPNLLIPSIVWTFLVIFFYVMFALFNLIAMVAHPGQLTVVELSGNIVLFFIVICICEVCDTLRAYQYLRATSMMRGHVYLPNNNRM